jgi:hypothetical protein
VGPEAKILVIVPTRDRPKQLADLVHSVLHTSTSVDVAAYIDDDQKTLYGWTESPLAHMIVRRGPRIGPLAAANLISRDELESYAAFGFVPDDAKVTTPAWDEHVIRQITAGAMVVAPAHKSKDVDMPFVSREWVKRLGYFAWPGLYHWGWPSVVAALGLATESLRQSLPSEFWIDHPGLDSKNRDRYPADIIALYDFFASHFGDALNDLKGHEAAGRPKRKETAEVSGSVQ